MINYSEAEHINVGYGKDLSIMELARLIADVVGYEGQILTDPAMPDGTPQKLLSTDALHACGRLAKTPLRLALHLTYTDFVQRKSE